MWSPPSGARTAPSPKGDLTLRGAEIFGSNVFGPDEQRKRLPKQVFRQLQATIDRGETLEADLADAGRAWR